MTITTDEINKRKSLVTVNEAALLSDSPERAVRKAIEDRVISCRKAKVKSVGPKTRETLDVYTVAVLSVLLDINLPVSKVEKIRISKHLRNCLVHGKYEDFVLNKYVFLSSSKMEETARAVFDKTSRYTSVRDAWVHRDPGIKGGTPVIKGTRMTVYSVLGRVENGDSLNDIAKENPDIPREALEAAITFAKANPMRGRPSGRPWEKT